MALVVKNLPANAGDLREEGLIPRSGRSPEEGHGNPLQYPCLKNPMARGAWRATVHGVTRVGRVCVCVLSPFSCVQLFLNLWTVAHQAPLSNGILHWRTHSYWSGLPFPSSGDLPEPRIISRSPHCRQILYH